MSKNTIYLKDLLHRHYCQRLSPRPLLRTMVLFALLACLMMACEISTKVSIDKKSPPTFTLSGSGVLAQLYVFGPLPNLEKFQETPPIMWQLDPGPDMRNKSFSDLPPITYGKLPPGFTQIIPKEGEPPPLIEGQLYTVTAHTFSAPGGYTNFTVREGKTVILPNQ